MPTLERIDLHGESSLFISAENTQANRGQRGLIVTDLDGTSLTGDKKQAYEYLLANLTASHPADASLPLAGVQLQTLRPTVVRGAAVYGHSAASNPTLDPWDMGRIRYFGDRRQRVIRRIYRDAESELAAETISDPGIYVFESVPLADRGDPTPDDQVLSLNIGFSRSPIFQIDVPAGRLTDNPLAVMEDLCRTHNEDAVTIAGFDFIEGRLKCIGWQADSIDRQGSVERPSVYSYHYSPIGFLRISVDREQTYIGPEDGSGFRDIGNRWTIEIQAASPSAEFADAFPVHDGTGPPAAEESSSS